MHTKIMVLPEDVDYEVLIHGTTLKVYKFLMKHPGAIGVRELQRTLDFSSPSVAAHHLNKLEEWGLCGKQTDNKYILVKKVNIGILKHFIIINGRYLPRFAFHLGFFLSLLLSYTIFSFFIDSGLYDRLIAFSTLLGVVIILGYETWRLYKMYEKGF